MIGLLNVLVVIFLLGLHSSILATGIGTAIVCVIGGLFFLTSLRSGVDSYQLSTVFETKVVKEDRDEAKANRILGLPDCTSF